MGFQQQVRGHNGITVGHTHTHAGHCQYSERIFSSSIDFNIDCHYKWLFPFWTIVWKISSHRVYFIKKEPKKKKKTLNLKGESNLHVNHWNSQTAYINFLLLSTSSVLNKEALIMVCRIFAICLLVR